MSNFSQRLLTWPALELHPIDLHHSRGRLENTIGQFAIVGQEHQAGNSIVEPPDREDSFGHAAQQMAQRGPAFRIGHGGHHVDGLVEQEIARLGWPLGHAARGFDTVALRVRFRAQFGDHDAVDAHLSAADEFFGVAPRGDASTGDYFLQSFEHD